MIRELILAVEDDDKWNRAERVAGLICDALGMAENVEYPHNNSFFE